jgi:2-haloacid dehalogenase
MKKHYPWLFFDADDTLFDYNTAEATALKRTFHSLSLPYEDSYLDVYQRVNSGLWQALEKQEISPAVLRFRRFELLLENLQMRGPSDQMSSVYLEQLAICSQLLEDAHDVLQALHKTSRILIVTNGLQAVQRSRLTNSAIRDLITDIVISEEIGSAKPHTTFFDAAFSCAGNPPKKDVLIIGDSLTSDIQGGVNYAIDTCWFNRAGNPRPEHPPITYEIRQLRDLLDLLG